MENKVQKKIKLIEAFVSCNKKYAEGTITVIVKRKFRHAVYGKIINKSQKQIVQFDQKECLPLNTRVFIAACAPISKRKRFRIVGVSNVN